MSKPNYYEIVARKKLGKSDDWKWCRLEHLDDGTTLCEGGIPTEKFKSGPNKGGDKWNGIVRQKLIITDEDLDKARDEYEQAYNVCGDCGGSGQVNIGWSKAAGNRYGPCKRCNGTGNCEKKELVHGHV